MITAELVVCAQTVIRDASTNNFSLINVIQEMKPQTLPSLFPSLNLFVVLRRDESDPRTPKVKVTIKMGNGYSQEMLLNVDFQDKLGTRVHTEFQGFPILAPGPLVFTVFQDGEPVKELGKWVIQVGEPINAQEQKLPAQA